MARAEPNGREGDFVIRVTIGAMPALLRAIVGSAIAEQEDFLVTDAPKAPPQPDLVEPECDVLLACPDRAPQARINLAALAGTAPPAIVAIDAVGDRAAILRISRDERHLTAPGDLSSVIRQAAVGRPGGSA